MFGGGYNATSHQVPTVAGYKEERKHWDEQADEYARIVEQRANETEERRRRAVEGTEQQHAQGQAGGMDKKETMGEKVEEGKSGKGGNVLKSAKEMKDDVDPNKPANEKQRMMDQMNAHKSRFFLSVTSGPGFEDGIVLIPITETPRGITG